MIFGYPSQVYTALGNPGWTPAELSRTQLQQAGVWPDVVINPPQQQVSASPPTGQSVAQTAANQVTPANTAQKQQQAQLALSVDILGQGLFESVDKAFKYSAASSTASPTHAASPATSSTASKATPSASKSASSASQSPTSAMNSLVFGNDAFPNATQAAFGMGGQGYGYGGFAQGATVSVTGPTINVPAQQTASAPTGMESMPMVLIGGMLLIVIIIVMAMRR